MNILLFAPHKTIYAGRMILEGYKNAFSSLGHNCQILYGDDNHEKIFDRFQPNILLTGLNNYILKFLDVRRVKKQKKKGMKVFVNVPFWKSPFSAYRISEPKSLSNNINHINLINSGEYGDIYYNVGEQGDPRMDGFEKKNRL